MTRRIPGLMFETVAEPAADMGGGGESAPEPVESFGETAPEGEHVEAAAAAPEPFDPHAYFDTPEGRQLLDQQVAARVPQPEPEPQQQQGFRPPPDPWTSDNWAQEMAEWQAERDQAIIAAVTSAPGFQHAEQQHVSQWTGSIFEKVETDIGRPLAANVRNIAERAAVGSIPPPNDPAARNFDGAATLSHYAKEIDALIQSERAAAVKAYQEGVNPAERQAGATEPPAGGIAAIHARPVASSHREVTQRYLRGE